ncbi:MAG: hypothetical protein BJ554DRAFT_239 [Olpidium bornovanus]|uniref:Secreted protein n=1 Tax=Olpidium bornovanus TaxID=278681 RepID=A0A8H7ZUH2_9FUNG|nr:MAG: hypothetical protein BJ554DRAFT_239 [Olpidium bornovanus]
MSATATLAVHASIAGLGSLVPSCPNGDEGGESRFEPTAAYVVARGVQSRITVTSGTTAPSRRSECGFGRFQAGIAPFLFCSLTRRLRWFRRKIADLGGPREHARGDEA